MNLYLINIFIIEDKLEKIGSDYLRFTRQLRVIF